jgi:hypothetical protein
MPFFASKELREAGGEIVNRALGRCVGEQGGIRKIGINRRRIDDRTAGFMCGTAAFVR